MKFEKLLECSDFKIGQKIKGKYLIYKIEENGICLCKANDEEYQFKPLYKNKETEGILSENAHKLTNIKHQNIHNIEVLEDNDYFYLVSKQDLQAEPLSNIIFKKRNGEVWFERLFECYLQVCEALKFLHAQNIYHGNISPQNILVESYSYKVFLLDFGHAYYYALLDSDKNPNIQQNHFASPEQYRNKIDVHGINDMTNDNYMQCVSIETDIFSFGLCMLKMLTDTYDESIFEIYKSYHNIDEIFNKIYEYELEDVEKELYPIIKTMLNIEPTQRPKIGEVYEKLISIYKNIRKSNQYEINILKKEAEKYCNENEISIIEIKNHFAEKLKNSYPYVVFEEKGEKENINIAFMDVAFKCSADEGAHLFCFGVSNNPKDIENIRKNGIMLYDSFVITTGSPEKKYNDTSYLKEELKKKFEEQQSVQKQLNQDMVAIDTEGRYLQAIEKWLENERNTQKVQLKHQDKASNILIFEIIYEAKNIFELKNESAEAKEALAQRIFEDDLSDNPNTDVFETLQKIYKEDIFTKKSKSICQKIQERNEKVPQNIEQQLNQKPKLERYQLILFRLYKEYINSPKKQDKQNKTQEKEFKKGDKIVFDKEETPMPKYQGKITNVNARNNTISIEVDIKTIRKDFDKKASYFVSRDCEMEERILKKEKNALESLKESETACPRLLTKINKPSILQDTDLCELPYWFNETLDDNQKLAVKKALSLDSNADILLIQGPPGTGKTTTITEIVQQYLRENKHEKILVVSQSHQAVDNVLEKICEKVKVVRIGKVEEGGETKLSKMAQNYTETKVLDKLICDTINRIKDNPTDKPEFKQIQQEFLESLQSLSQQISETKTQGQKTVDSELADIFLKDIRVIFGTLIGISSYRNFRGMEFGLVIVDEAGRAFLSELLVPLIKAKKIILVGDHKQLAPVVKEEIEPFLYQVKITEEQAKESFFGRFYERMQESNKEKLYHFLNTNYRSHRDICRLYSESFYDGKLQTSKTLKREHNLEFYNSSVIILSTSKLKDKNAKQKTGEYGWYNLKHIQIIKQELEKIFKELQENHLQKSIGIISPYRLQVNKLREALKNFKDKIDIGTVDSFQGSDRDIIIYDSVRSGNKNENITFISDEKRLNVSLSRAKELLIVVGDMDFLYTAETESNNPFKDILEKIYNDYPDSKIEWRD